MSKKPTAKDPIIIRLRWDHADVASYYATTGCYLQDELSKLESFEVSSEHSPEGDVEFIDETYDNMVHVLNLLAPQFILAHGHSFYKFWWSQEMDMLKDNAIKSDKLWKAAGRPYSGMSLNCAKKIKPHIN